MLTSKERISEQVLRRLKKYSEESDIDSRDVMLEVEQSLSSLIRVRYFQSKMDEYAELDGSLIYTLKENKLSKDEDTDEYFIKIPATTISLPFGIDISRVGTKKGAGYKEVPYGFNDLYDGLDAYGLEGSIGYYREGTMLKFVNMTSQNKPENVFVKMVLPIDSLEEDDEINIPKDMVDEVVSAVMQKYYPPIQLPSDQNNNSNDL